MSGAWSNQRVTSITIPTGAVSGARIVIGNQIPQVLLTFATANNFVFNAVIIKYFGTTDDAFYWEAVGFWPGTGETWFTGTWDAVNGVYLLDRVFVDQAGPGQISKYVGTTNNAINAFTLDMAVFQSTFRVHGGLATEGLILVGQSVGGKISQYIGGVTETWHNPTFNAPTWLNFGVSQRACQYARMPEDAVWLVGDVKSSVAVTSGSQILTVAASYAPPVNISFPSVAQLTTGAVVPCTINALTTGAVTYSATSTAGQVAILSLSHIRWPMS